MAKENMAAVISRKWSYLLRFFESRVIASPLTHTSIIFVNSTLYINVLPFSNTLKGRNSPELLTIYMSFYSFGRYKSVRYSYLSIIRHVQHLSFICSICYLFNVEILQLSSRNLKVKELIFQRFASFRPGTMIKWCLF